MQLTTHYITYRDYGDLGVGFATDPTDFDTACGEYAEARASNKDAAVFRVDPPENGNAGMFVDVTDYAEERIAQWCNDRGDDLPIWMDGAICGYCHREVCTCDAAYDAYKAEVA